MADDFAKHDDITYDILKASKNVRHVTNRKRKQSLALSEYLSKKRKKHNVKREQQNLQVKIGNVAVGQFQNEFEKFTNSENATKTKEVCNNGKKHACKKLALNQSRQKSAKYMRTLHRDNPGRYVELEALKAIKKENELKARRMKERKEKIIYEKKHGPFVLNEITGEMQLLSKVQKKDCKKCTGYKTANFGTQVCPLDIGENVSSVHVQTSKLLLNERCPSCTSDKSINTQLTGNIPMLKSAQTCCVNMEMHDTDYTANCKAIL